VANRLAIHRWTGGLDRQPVARGLEDRDQRRRPGYDHSALDPGDARLGHADSAREVMLRHASAFARPPGDAADRGRLHIREYITSDIFVDGGKDPPLDASPDALMFHLAAEARSDVRPSGVRRSLTARAFVASVRA
jgi:hypothetical protein